ncbi:MAG: porin [Reyranellaceae bacterium]
MKKLLLGSTALAAAGLFSASALAADPIKVTVGGYYQWYFVVGGWDKDDEGDDGRADSIRQEGEIHFNGITKLDNGTNVGFRVELEAYTTGDQVDEHYLFLSGDWGRFELGATNGVMSKMVQGVATVRMLPGYGFNSQNFNFGTSGNGWTNSNSAYSTAIQDDRHNGDANKISYFTPRFSGFQLGVSYTPEFRPGTNGNACGATGGASTSFGACTKNNAGDFEHAFQAAVNYVATFNSVNLALYGGMMYASPETEFNGAGTELDDWWHWLVGANVTVQGFSLGFNIGKDTNGTKRDTDTWMYTVAGSYTTGPWSIGAGWRMYDRNVPGFKDDKVNQFELGAQYALGPGITLAGGLIWNLSDGDNDLANRDNDSWQAVFGIAIGF